MKKRHIRENNGTLDTGLYAVGSLYEFVTVRDLQDKAAISNKTAGHLADREIVAGKAKDNIYLDSVLVEEDSITFKFGSFATTEAYDEDHEYKKVGKRHKLEQNPDQEYSIYLKFLNTQTWAKNMKGRRRVEPSNIESLLNNAYVQIWSTSPAWHYQGHNYWSSQLDASIFPTNKKPERWDKFHNETQLDKHTAHLLANLSDFHKDMAKAVAKELR